MAIDTYLVLAAIVVAVAATWFFRRLAGKELLAYVSVVGGLAVMGICLVWLTPHDVRTYIVSVPQMIGFYALALAGAALVFGAVEFGLLRLVGLFRLGAITRVTYYESLLQPFTLILLFLGLAVILVFGFWPFFTLNEDHKMYRDVAVSLVFLFTLPVMIFASTKVIDEEIENRTMLTLMSKPIARWQVVLGKYFGVLLLCVAMLAALGIMAGVCSYVRYFDDLRIDYYTASTVGEKAALDFVNYQALRAFPPALLLQLLQIATLAAVSVAVSTRFGLAVNVTVVVVIYMAANLMRYAGLADLPGPVHWVVVAISNVLPGLGYLDLNQRLVYGEFTYGETFPGIPTYGQIWQYVGTAAVYAGFYIAACLSFGMALFRTRELT